MKLVKYIGCIRTAFRRRTASINKPQHRDASVSQVPKVYCFPTRIEQRAVRCSFDRRQCITARRRRLVIAVARKKIFRRGGYDRAARAKDESDRKESTASAAHCGGLLSAVSLGPLPMFFAPKSMWCGRPSFSAVKSRSKRGVSSLPFQV